MTDLIKRISSLVLVALFAATLVQPAAARTFKFIRDTEIENTIRVFSTPVFQAAGLDPSAIEVYIVNDPTLNAFVAGGQKLFLNTGLLMQSADADQVIGVIAHEAGHIAGGDLARLHDVMRKSSAQQILAMVLGAAAGIASGRGDVGAAIAAGGARTGQENFFQYSRSQEAAADAAAMRFLDATGTPATGLLEFLGTLADQELLSTRFQDPYLRTHPITRERVQALENHIKESTQPRRPPSLDHKRLHARMQAKLLAFLEPPSRTLGRFPESDTSLPARYARAIAYYKVPDLEKALPLIDQLIAEQPTDPYFHEMKGQMLFENRRAAEAIPSYEAAVRLLPSAPLLRLDLARIQLEMNDPVLLDAAIENLRIAQQAEPSSSWIWRNLAIAYGRKGDKGLSTLALAEEAYFRGNLREAREYAKRAEKLLPADSTAALQAQDILHATVDLDGDGKPDDE
ncbi:MAG: M48 family metalloprotease [Rhodospirillales bacterium]|jgi:predicted Zn-dependent protease|nr:M48 family metalloprotease [Rhodospirillales bacterium]